MKRLNGFFVFALIVLSFIHYGFVLTPQETELQIKIRKIRNAKGSVRICAFKDQKSFEENTPYKVIIVKKDAMKQGELSVSMKVHAGVCGIAILDDENNNQKMEYGLIFPSEGFGFSNYFHSGMSHPKFAQFQFKAEPNKTNSTSITVKYY